MRTLSILIAAGVLTLGASAVSAQGPKKKEKAPTPASAPAAGVDMKAPAIPATCKDPTRFQKSCLREMHACFQPNGQCTGKVDASGKVTMKWANGATLTASTGGRGGGEGVTGMGEAKMGARTCFTMNVKVEDLKSMKSRSEFSAGGKKYVVSTDGDNVEVICPGGARESWKRGEYESCAPAGEGASKGCKMEGMPGMPQLGGGGAGTPAGGTAKLVPVCKKVLDCICKQQGEALCKQMEAAISMANNEEQCNAMAAATGCQ
ncbi:MAG: hypothetical protein GMKNLPBB_01893 [Myxococcota bacterium]|nr:hypothetical protein [Myxococcota bacterium]